MGLQLNVAVSEHHVTLKKKIKVVVKDLDVVLLLLTSKTSVSPKRPATSWLEI